jgi:hypothetical protein
VTVIEEQVGKSKNPARTRGERNILVEMLKGTTTFDRDDFASALRSGSLSLTPYTGTGYPSFSVPGLLATGVKDGKDWEKYQLIEIQQMVSEFPGVRLTLYLPVFVGKSGYRAYDRYELSSDNSTLTVWEDISKRLQLLPEDFDDHKIPIQLERTVVLHHAATLADFETTWTKCLDLIETALQENTQETKGGTVVVKTSKREVMAGICGGRSDINLMNVSHGIDVYLKRKQLPYTSTVRFSCCSHHDLKITLERDTVKF